MPTQTPFPRMAPIALSVLLIFIPVLFSGCAHQAADQRAQRTMSAQMDSSQPMESDRLLIRSARVEVAVSSPEVTAGEIRAEVTELGGWVSDTRINANKSHVLNLRIPEEKLDAFLESTKATGKLKSFSVSATDVTDSFRDNEANLNNLTALRDRLHQLLEQASDVQDILAVEKELNRVQSEIDRIQGWLTRTSGRITMAEVHLTISQKRIPGPLGYVFKGIGWTVKKLFVIR
ncbi:MAG: DUF4349 domain-containing protein [Candidatus Sumerlaeia bacterium]|nr:DUF4349 domain-containing protein [Candidatus Sumerlaeia bacterium]